MRVRTLLVDDDGMAEVDLMTDPMPRHISIVKWGSNGYPAQSWRSAPEFTPAAAATALRATPTISPTAKALQNAIEETMSALRAVIADCMNQNVTSGERGSMITAYCSQAGARLAIIARSLGPQKSARAAADYSGAGISRPKTPDGTTLQSEFSRRAFDRWVDESLTWAADAVMIAFRDAETNGSSDGLAETVLTYLGYVGWDLSWYVQSLPDGQIGAAQRSSPDTTLETNNMLNKTDLLAALRDLAVTEPAAFLELNNRALKAAADSGVTVRPTAAMRAAWGETGAEGQPDPAGQLALGAGDQLDRLIANSLQGIDFSVIPSGASPFTTAMRSAIERGVKAFAPAAATIDDNMIIAAIKRDLESAAPVLGDAVKKLVAPSVVNAIRGVVSARNSNQLFAQPEAGSEAGGAKVDPWRAEIPS